ncbi:LysR family transcriptional regulator [Aeribacillus sp. FSL K6-8394]|uniref:LysR family transcriptional regulator n=1 Tax=Aeribacillus sp. FSL K6-8394 TaxID=2954570 RepID=UPI0030F769B2
MDLESLKMFCLVVEEGSISRAAKLVYVSQPAVTRKIHQLEDYYGTPLFDRSNGKMTLTKAGKMLYPIAKNIVEEIQQSKEAVKEITGHKDFTLSVGATLTIGEYLLPSLLGKFKKEVPDVKLSLAISNTPGIIDRLVDRKIDIGFVEGVVENSIFHVKKLVDDELILVCGREHPLKKKKQIDIEELAKEKMIWREKNSGTRLIIENTLKKYGVLDKINYYMELGSTQAVKAAIESGLGIGFLPRITVSRELKYGYLYELKIKDVEIKRHLSILSRTERFRKEIVDEFIDFIYKKMVSSG